MMGKHYHCPCELNARIRELEQRRDKRVASFSDLMELRNLDNRRIARIERQIGT